MLPLPSPGQPPPREHYQPPPPSLPFQLPLLLPRAQKLPSLDLSQKREGRKRKSWRGQQRKAKRRKQKEMSWDQRRDKAFSSASALCLEKSKKLLKIQYGFLADPAQPVRSNIATTRGTSQFRSIFPSLLIAPVITSYTNSPSLRHQISTRLRIQLLPSVQIIFKQH